MKTILERIREQYPALTPQERRAADFMHAHLDDLAVYNATEVAGLSGVSKATVSRLYRRLGFDSAEELRDHVRTLRGAPRVSEHPSDFGAHLDREISNLRMAVSGLDLAAAAGLIAEARRVVVIGFRTSYPMALHLRQQLTQARDAVAVAPQPGQSIGEEIASLDARDVAVLVGFPRRPREFGALVTGLAASPARVVLLTDATGRGYASRVDEIVEIAVGSVTSFDSYAAVASIIGLLASAVLAADPARGRARLAAIGAAYDSLHELE
ncbi:MurR/RpiR family transcriptional regulator [Lacisediminihabitans changchengi]|uniref:MurR/RpiR family transcriptional regulator n=1 Tax=Lacisediminihabitans changchengi TaxID=2787634 RepID=A0A934SQK0_9MICO|nr:MurR/RpiR family transcriptional regulator [Lacisediminihabitans changchengi]MBK4346349.1 MurR/RpiR family transcriptional regulator [Lacisediminihabitans changchengi]